MKSREKVIKGLEACLLAGTKEDCVGYGCPYLIYNDEVSDDCQMQMFEDAIALLKAQEPRVVKMSELTAGEPMLVWLEDIDKEETVAGMIFDYVPGRLGFKLTYHGCMDRIYPLIDEYLTRWRCWTSRPTDEQRSAIPWE